MTEPALFRPWIAALLLAFAALCASHSVMGAEPKRVLLLHSFGRDFAPYDAIVAAFRTELAKGSSEPLAVYDATLDAEQISSSDDPQPLLELLRHRFAGSPPDLVVTVGPPAAAFYLRYRDRMFPATPVVVSALDERLVRASALREGDAAVAIHQNLPGLIDHILRVLPDTRKIVVVIGDTPLERFWLGEAHREFAPFANRVSFEWLNKLSLEQMRQRLADLPAHCAVLYTLMVTDAAGVPHDRGSALASLYEVSAAPIFSLYESELGHGVVGGPYHSQQRGGALMAAAALRALSGQNLNDPTIQLLDYETPVYDWRELKRWGIDHARLPQGSKIRFEPPSLWDEHRLLIMTSMAIFVLQAALLIGLVWQRSHRRRAEQEAQALSGRLITAHEDERRRLARELHDDITQRLAGLAIDATRLPGDELPASEIDARRSIHRGLVQLSEDVHNLSYRLHPSVLDDLGLVEALKAECDRVARTETVRVDVKADNLPRSLSKDVALCIYRVAQEALRNIARHAKASTVQLSLALIEDGVRLAVSDDGSGFEYGRQNRGPSLGHASMQERLRLLHGRLEIESKPGRGTTVVAWVPLPEVPA